MMISLYIIIFFSFLFFKYQQKGFVFSLLISVLLFQCIYIYDFYQINQQQKLFVLHKNRKSIIVDKTGNHLKVFIDPYHSIQNSSLLENFKTQLASEIDTFQLKNFHQTPIGKNLLIIDSLGIWQLPKGIHANYVLLSVDASSAAKTWPVYWACRSNTWTHPRLMRVLECSREYLNAKTEGSDLTAEYYSHAYTDA